jgi:Peroxisomal biogenesis factor 11 (PEX11)
MHTLEVARFDVAVLALYFNKAEARDKFCRAIQYFAKFINNGQPGIAYDIEKSSSMARKAFRIFKVINFLYFAYPSITYWCLKINKSGTY